MVNSSRRMAASARQVGISQLLGYHVWNEHGVGHPLNTLDVGPFGSTRLVSNHPSLLCSGSSSWRRRKSKPIALVAGAERVV